MKISYKIFIIFISLIPLKIYSAPCYGPKMPEKGKFFMGYQNYFIFQRHLEKEEGELRSIQYFYNLTYAINNRLAVDLKAGLGNIKQHPLGEDEIDYSTSFAGGYGFRFKLLNPDKYKRINLIFGFQHISVHPHTTRVNTDKHTGILDDWQVSLIASRQTNSFLKPYLGIKWSRTDYIHWENGQRKRVMSDLTKSWGIVVGADIILSQDYWLNIEFQAIDLSAMSLGLVYKF